MPALTRRRCPDARQECWLIYYGDVHVGTIAIRSGIPHDKDPWGWRCGFYPGSEPGEYSPSLLAIAPAAKLPERLKLPCRVWKRKSHNGGKKLRAMS
jgi:hypothetical protein